MQDSAYICAQQALNVIAPFHRWAAVCTVQRPEGGGLSFRQLSALYIIRKEPTTSGHLARRLRVAPAVATGLIDRLEKRGYVQRCRDPDDGRRVRLILTEEGRAISEALEHGIVAEFAQGMTQLTPDELNDLHRGLTVLGRVVAERLTTTVMVEDQLDRLD